MKWTALLVALAAMLATVFNATPALAQPTRVFVAAQGSDGNACTFAAPCRTFQKAHDTVAANGEIDVLDPAGYGILTITKSISIQGHDFSGTTVPSGGTGITINAGPNDQINLRGLIIEGAGVGYNGIAFNSGSRLNVANCTIRGLITSAGLTAGGIVLQPTFDARISISDTTISGNQNIGINYKSSANVTVGIVMTRLLVDGNSDGITLLQSQNGSLIAEIIDSIVSHNTTGVGIYGKTYAIIDNSRMVKNYFFGVDTGFPSTTFLRRSTIFGNETTGVIPDGEVYSYGDNSIHANATDIGGAGLLLTAPLR